MKQTILMCCGPDRSGKTNILKATELVTGIPVFKASSERDNFLRGQDKFLNEIRYADPRTLDLLTQVKFSVLMDRAYPCEWVYSRYFGRLSDDAMIQRLDERYAALGAKVLICTRRSFAGIKDDLNESLNGQELHKISELYMRFAEYTRCKTHVLYTDDENLSREVGEVVKFINED